MTHPPIPAGGVRRAAERGRPTDVPHEVLEEVVCRREAGEAWSHAASAVGFSVEVLRARLDPEFLARRKAQWAKRPKDFRLKYYRETSIGAVRHTIERIRPDEVERLRDTVPLDTRNFTGKAMGDPLPGRSALDAKRAPH
jgi:hypothetical protein